VNNSAMVLELAFSLFPKAGAVLPAISELSELVVHNVKTKSLSSYRQIPEPLLYATPM
jgi:hypothetical protein